MVTFIRGALAAACALLTLMFAATPAPAVTLGLQWTGHPYMAVSEMDEVGRSGADLFRVPMAPSWTPKTGVNQYNWSTYDTLFGEAAKHGVRILPHFGGRLDNTHHLPQSSEQAAWTNWAQQAVTRYGYGGTFWAENPQIPYTPVIAWEMWNEPDVHGVAASQFGWFLSWAAPAVQQASVGRSGQMTEILFGGLLSWSGGTNYQTYLSEAWSVPGASAALTGVALHPYAMESWDNNVNFQTFKTTVQGARDFIKTLSGGAGKSLWLTEVGWAAEGAEYAKGQPGQSWLLKEAIDWTQANAAALNMRVFIWYNYRDIEPEIWQYRSGLRRQNGEYRLAWYTFQQEAGALSWPPPKYADELGFVRFNSASTHLDTYTSWPTYKTLASSADTGYPKISDPQNVQALALDTNGDAVDGLSFLRFNPAGASTVLDSYANPPNFNVLAAHCATGYPKVTDPQNVQALAIDWSAGTGDELGFVRFNSATGKTHLDTYTGGPCYGTLASNSDTDYPAISDPQNVQAVALDTDGNGIDELAFVRLKGPNQTKTVISVYAGAPQYRKGILTCNTGYPAVADPENVQVIAIDGNSDGKDELGFVRFNPATLHTHLDTYTGAPCYDVLASNSDVGYPKIPDPQNVQALPINWNTSSYQAPPQWSQTDLGGSITSDPDISSWGLGRLDVFARGASPENALWHRAFSTNWLGWEKIGGSLNSGPGAVSWGLGRIDVVARKATTDPNTVDSLDHWWFNGSSFPFDNLGRPSSGQLKHDPDVSSWSENRLDVFATGADNALWHKAWQFGWFGWEKLPGPSLTSGPGAVSWGVNRIDIVAQGPNEVPLHWWFDGTKFNLEEQSGKITSAPDISSWGVNRLDIFARGPEGRLVHRSWNGSSWSAWESLGGPLLIGGPSAVSWGPKRIDVVARVTGDKLWHWSYQE